MAGLRMAAAQSASIALDIEVNVALHLDFIAAAAGTGAELLVFPELSLCGYELDRMAQCAVLADDARLAPLRERAMEHRMAIVVGAPVAPTAPGGLPAIGAITFHADGRRSVYRKHFLHSGEELHASAGSALTQIIDVRATPVALAICADTGNQQHPHAAAVAGARVYAAGMLISTGGYEADSTMLAAYAKLFGMRVLMANHATDSGGYATAGRSAIWAADGKLIVAAPGPGTLLVVADDDVSEVLSVSH